MIITKLEQYPQVLAALQTLKEPERIAHLRYLCQNDLYFLLRYACERKDLEHPWIFERCREVQAEQTTEALALSDISAIGATKATVATAIGATAIGMAGTIMAGTATAEYTSISAAFTAATVAVAVMNALDVCIGRGGKSAASGTTELPSRGAFPSGGPIVGGNAFLADRFATGTILDNDVACVPINVVENSGFAGVEIPAGLDYNTPRLASPQHPHETQGPTTSYACPDWCPTQRRRRDQDEGRALAGIRTWAGSLGRRQSGAKDSRRSLFLAAARHCDRCGQTCPAPFHSLGTCPSHSRSRRASRSLNNVRVLFGHVILLARVFGRVEQLHFAGQQRHLDKLPIALANGAPESLDVDIDDAGVPHEKPLLPSVGGRALK